MSIPFIILCILIAVCSIALVTLILLQKKQAAGFTSSMGLGSTSQNSSYWNRNKKNSYEGKLELYTKIVAVIYAVLILVSNFVK